MRRPAQYLTNGEDPFGFKRLQYIREATDSKKLNDLHGPFVVISASGMCEQGRILHHLRNNIEDPRNTVLITGFQAADTLGRKLVEKWPEVRIFGEPMRVRAEIASLDELSGHADQGELLEWIKPMAPTPAQGLPGPWRAQSIRDPGQTAARALRPGGGLPGAGAEFRTGIR